MSARLSARFAALKAENRAGLIAYVMGGDPDWDTSLAVVRALIASGADIIELGFPFTDPMADGPAIQAAAERALKAGASLESVMRLAHAIRQTDTATPLILMGYLNPAEQMGPQAFALAVQTADIDGVILVDLPPEEDADFREALSGKDVALIRFATPTTDETRMKTVLEGASGFVYYVSVAGVTGQKAAPAEAAKAAVLRLQAATDLPIAVGFGVRDAASAAAIAANADAVVVGSALVEVVRAASEAGATGEALATAVGEAASALSLAVRSARLRP